MRENKTITIKTRLTKSEFDFIFKELKSLGVRDISKYIRFKLGLTK